MDNYNQLQTARGTPPSPVVSLTTIGGGDPSPWLFSVASVEPKYWFVLTLSFAGALCAEVYRRKKSNPENGLANLLTGTIVGLVIGLTTLLEPELEFGAEPTRILVSFVWGAFGRWAFAGLMDFLERLKTDPKGAIDDLLSIFPKELLGDFLDLVRRRYFNKGDGQNNQNNVE